MSSDFSIFVTLANVNIIYMFFLFLTVPGANPGLAVPPSLLSSSLRLFNGVDRDGIVAVDATLRQRQAVGCGCVFRS